MGQPLPPADHKISLADAAEMTRRYREQTEHTQPFPIGAFHRQAYERILAQPGCVGIRAYPGVHKDGSVSAVLVGVDEKGNDLVDGELAQDMFFCPPVCSDGNQLNQG